MGADLVAARAMRLEEGSVRRAARSLVPSVPAAMLSIALLELSLATAGFHRTWRWIQERTARVALLTEVDEAAVARAEYAVAMAAALYPGRAVCLERSLVLYWYLRRRGVAVRYRMGVQMYPFLAHAWVEYRGEPINDVPEHVRRFRPITGMDA
jgi:hypothetical protein